MKTNTLSLFLTLWLLYLPLFLEAQKNKHILDIFYEALQADSTRAYVPNLDGYITISNTRKNGFHETINPQTLLERYPSARKYLTADSTLIFAAQMHLKGILFSETDDPRILFENLEFPKGFKGRLLVKKKGEQSANEVLYGSRFVFNNIKAKGHSQFDVGGNYRIYIRNSDWQKLDIAAINPPVVEIDQCNFDDLALALLTSDNVSVKNSTIKHCNIYGVAAGSLSLINNVFEPRYWDGVQEINDSSSYLRKELVGHQFFQVVPLVKTIDNFELKDNHFKNSDQNTSALFEAAGNSVIITGNTFDANLRLANRTSSKFEMYDNKFSAVSMMASLPSTPQGFVNIRWPELKGKLVWKRDAFAPTYFGENDLELADFDNYNNLISSYRKLVEIYKNSGNTSYANDVYLEMKDLETARFKYVMKTEGGADNLFRFRLHQLLSMYTRHGTNPAQAMTASVWLIFLFSILYFFFPSDWDAKSKPQLIADFRTLIEKNEQGYFWPFMSLTKGLLISMFNAFILSVNSFVTLGFGRIPTKGLAKYICILEGFLGWFLLSIFIVSLINQVLF